ncbi:MAG: sialidase family protein, partial [Planctomycetota bacterium]|nr:sialidase family protein [Planctomycetota bacterium]
SDPSWSAPRRLCDGIMLNKPTVLSDGRWILPAAVWESEPRGRGINESFLHDLGDLKGGNLFVSTDQGDTWDLLGQTRVDKRVYDEHMLIERNDGSLWTLVRTAYGIGESVSFDGGKNWSEGKPSGIRNANSRFHIRRLNSGRLLLVHHDPPGEFDGAPPRSHLTVHLSEDDGKSWKGGLLIDERKGVSYPDAVETDEGVIYLIYDHSRHEAMEILMATFTEEDVLAGKAFSDAAGLRMVVSRK